MSDQVNRRIVVEGDGSSFESLMEQLNRRAEELYDNLSESAVGYSDDLDLQKRKMDELIRKEEEFIRKLRDQKRLQIETRFDQKLSSMHDWERKGEGGRVVERERAEALRELNKEYRENRVVTSHLRERRIDDQRFQGSGGDSGGGFLPMLGGVGSTIMGGIGAGLGFGALMGLSNLVGSLFSLGTQLSETRMNSRAMTGDLFGSAESLGMNETEFTRYAMTISQTRGRGKRGGRPLALDQLSMERGFGLELGSMTELNAVARYGGSDILTLMTDFLNKANNSGLWDIDKGDFTQLNEKIGFLNRLTQQEAQLFETFTGNRSQEILSVFGRVFNMSGGRLGNRIDTLNRGITSPRNEFIQAEIMSTIAEDNPNMNLRQLRQIQQQGIFGKGVFGSVLRRLQKRSSSSEDLKLRLSLMFPELATNEMALEQLATADPSEFENIDDKTLRGRLGKYTRGNVRARGAQFTPPTSELTAKLEQLISEQGIKIVEPLANFASTGIDKIMQILGLREGVGEDTKTIKEEVQIIRKELTKEKVAEQFYDSWIAKGLGIERPPDEEKIKEKIKEKRIKASGGGSGQMTQAEIDSIFGKDGVWEKEKGLIDSLDRLNKSIQQLQPPGNNLNGAKPGKNNR